MTHNYISTDYGWNFDNSYARLPELYYSKTYPTKVKSPKLIVLNNSLASELGLNVEKLKSNEAQDVFAGNRIPEGALPIAQAYAGHQFGHFTMLGDGRALMLGEQITPGGERVDIQLKGSGRTPYSRRGDGRAALGPMLREYIISEAMHSLGIPTTRSLAVVLTGEPVFRETEEPGAVLTRIAASHIRVGTFEYAYEWGTTEELKALADYTIERHYPEVKDDGDRYIAFLKEVVKRQAILIAKWQLAGFIHGVMNTDNMTISGESIDYGPCAFMDTYDPGTVFSSIDTHGRYAYENQPDIAVWNLSRFAETLLQLLHENEDEAVRLAQQSVTGFYGQYHGNWLKGMRAKLGILNEEPQDKNLIEELLGIMYSYKADYTNTFRTLTLDEPDNTEMFCSLEFTSWNNKWKERLGRQKESKSSCRELMKRSNPAVIPRNHRVEEALKAAVKHGDFSVMEKLLDILSCPFEYSSTQNEYATLPEKTDRPYRTFCGT